MSFKELFIVGCVLNVAVFSAWGQGPKVEAPKSHEEALKLSINQAVALGLKDNLSLLAQKFDIEISEAEAVSASLWNNPSLFLDSQLMPIKSGNWDQRTAGGPTQRDLMLTVPVDVSGKKSKSRDALKLFSESQKLRYKLAQAETALTIKSIYSDVLTQNSKLTVFQQRLKLLESASSLISNRISGQQQPLLQNRLFMALQNSRIENENLVLSIDKKLNELKNLLKIPLAKKIELSTSLKDIPLSVSDLASFQAETKKSFPELLAIEKEKESLQKKQESINAKTWDDFGVVAGLSHQNQLDANPEVATSSSIPSAMSWTVGVTIPLPVFNRQQGEKAKVMAELNKASSLYEWKLLELERRTLEIWKLFQLQRQQIERFEKMTLKKSEELRDAAQRSFGSGGFSVFEYLDAIDSSFGTYNTYFTLLNEHHQTAFELNFLKGEL